MNFCFSWDDLINEKSKTSCHDLTWHLRAIKYLPCEFITPATPCSAQVCAPHSNNRRLEEKFRYGLLTLHRAPFIQSICENSPRTAWLAWRIGSIISLDDSLTSRVEKFHRESEKAKLNPENSTFHIISLHSRKSVREKAKRKICSNQWAGFSRFLIFPFTQTHMIAGRCSGAGFSFFPSALASFQRSIIGDWKESCSLWIFSRISWKWRHV